MRTKFALLSLALGLAAGSAAAADGLKSGTPDVKSAAVLAFGPDGVLFIGDAQGAAVFAVDTKDTSPAGKGEVNADKIDEKAAALLGTTAANIAITDVKVNPASGNVYMAVTRGKGPGAAPVILRLDRTGKLAEFALKDVPYAKAELAGASDRQRTMAITSMAFSNGKVIVAGMGNEEFASTLRAIKYPFDKSDKPTSVEVFHGAHGGLETKSPVQTFVPYSVGGKDEVVAAYTCTPLVRFPVDDLKPGQKVRGTTVAELGNRNKPLDMIVYSKGGKDYILSANSARGVMKIPAEALNGATPITEPVKGGGTAGVKYETVGELKDVVQLDKLDADRAVLLVKAGSNYDLKTIPLP